MASKTKDSSLPVTTATGMLDRAEKWGNYFELFLGQLLQESDSKKQYEKVALIHEAGDLAEEALKVYEERWKGV